jgi:hypothetical protein
MEMWRLIVITVYKVDNSSSSVSIVTRLWAVQWGKWFRIGQGREFYFSGPRPALGPTQPDDSFPAFSEVRNPYDYTSSVVYVFMVRCIIKYKCYCHAVAQLVTIPVEERSKARVCCLLLAGIAGSSPVGAWIFLLCALHNKDKRQNQDSQDKVRR